MSSMRMLDSCRSFPKCVVALLSFFVFVFKLHLTHGTSDANVVSAFATTCPSLEIHSAVLGELLVTSQLECVMRCLRHESCNSCNYCFNDPSSRATCTLTATQGAACGNNDPAFSANSNCSAHFLESRKNVTLTTTTTTTTTTTPTPSTASTTTPTTTKASTTTTPTTTTPTTTTSTTTTPTTTTPTTTRMSTTTTASSNCQTGSAACSGVQPQQTMSGVTYCCPSHNAISISNMNGVVTCSCYTFG